MSRTRMFAIGGAVLFVVVAVAITLLATREAPQPPQATPTETPIPRRTPKRRPVEQPQPFQVALAEVSASNIGNERLFGRSAGGRHRAIPQAARDATTELQRYLNGAFVQRDSRFTRAPVGKLLTARARRELTKPARMALGMGWRVRGGRSGRARASALVLHDSRGVVSVTLRYSAGMRVVLRNGRRQSWTQRGTLVMVPAGGRWKADMVDVELVRS